MTSTFEQTELHRHLDASFRVRTLFDMAHFRRVIPQSESFEAFKDRFLLKTPQKDLVAVLSCFTLFQKVLDRPEALDRLAYETVEDCYREGTRKVELRFSPSFVSEFSKLSWDDILLAFEKGRDRALKRYPDIQVGFLCIGSREQGLDKVSQSIDFYLSHMDRFVGFDLAGPEVGFPCKLYESEFRKLKQKPAAKITVHAGEAAGPENVWEAVSLLGAHRIGHGIHSSEDPKLLEELSSKRICLEVCPTSNWITQAVQTLESHPIKIFLEKGVPVSVNTDDPGIFGNSLLDELKICREKIGLSPSQLTTIMKSASEASFI